MGHLSQVVELSSMLPHDALKVYEQALTPHSKVSRGRGCCVRQHDDVACKVVKALLTGSVCALILRLPGYCAHASRWRIASMTIFTDASCGSQSASAIAVELMVGEGMHDCPV